MNLTGKTIVTENNKRYLLTDIIGRGAQGTVYGESSGDFLVKIYNAPTNAVAEKLLQKTKKLLNDSYPPRFIRPLEVVAMRNPNGELLYSGYVMRRVKGHIPLNKLLIPAKDISFADWYNGYSGGLRRRLYLSYQIAMNFFLLHRNNRAYCDISGNNILVAADKSIASTCMIDIDNLYTPGYAGTGILGTLRYMAPEILNEQMMPDIFTDDYSLAVLLYELIKYGHPYIGDAIAEGSPELENAAYRGAAAFVDDANDTSNRSSSTLPSDIILNNRLSNLFEKTFVYGKSNRMARATAEELALSCLEASNALIQCDKCEAWYFPHPNAKIEKNFFQCPWCEENNSLPPYFVVYERFPKYEGQWPKNNSGALMSARPLKTYFLRPGELNLITNNYVKRTFGISDIAIGSNRYSTAGNIKTHFIVTVESNFKYTVKNSSELNIYIRKSNQGNYYQLAPDQICRFEKGDAIYCDDGLTEIKDLSHHHIQSSKPTQVGSRLFFKLF